MGVFDTLAIPQGIALAMGVSHGSGDPELSQGVQLPVTESSEEGSDHPGFGKPPTGLFGKTTLSQPVFD